MFWRTPRTPDANVPPVWESTGAHPGSEESMDSRESRERKKGDLAASSQFLMIAIAFVFALVVLLVWHPWVTKPVNGVPRADVATARP
jgi:hypothetical protein